MIVVVIVAVVVVVNAGPNERRLLNDLFYTREYNKLERPVSNESEALNVSFGVVLQQIISVVSLHFVLVS